MKPFIRKIIKGGTAIGTRVVAKLKPGLGDIMRTTDQAVQEVLEEQAKDTPSGCAVEPHPRPRPGVPSK